MSTAAPPEPTREPRRPGLGAVTGVELTKLALQNHIRVVAVVGLFAPWIFILLITHVQQLPLETLGGRYLRITGFATPMVVLVFATQWVLPLLAALVVGDVFSSEDQLGTASTVLTRSVSRSALFWGKLTAATLVTVVLVLAVALSSLAAGLVVIGDQPYVDVGSAPVAPGRAVVLVLLSWVTVLPPVLVFAALAAWVSIVSRSSVLAVLVPVVVGLALQLSTLLTIAAPVRHVLPNAAFNAWRGLLDEPSYAGPLVRGLVVSAVYVVVLVAAGWVRLRRRDVTG